ncbi:hypothetical protein GF352_03775 [archaeon]|nr:hypothetical protein [archaeon]
MAKKKKKKEKKKEEEELPFANARVVRLIKSETGKIMIRSKVKEEMNRLLGRICKEISRRMAKMPYAYLGYSEFKEAAAPYLKIGLSIEEKKRLISSLKKIRQEAAVLAEELEGQLSEEDND